ncbi:TPA: hypothetical protein P2K97_004135 [Aeromonas salmonicida]|uniref:hypothetical protein n=1 Tax=Aeromonas salmonicida TaxID=645 RepID=UPI00044D1010|nr:hypothetical protein [Aeromonas salmonicida]ELI6442258.1 hypothetical protein [Aeromonas salmonicida subsp. salmonicida]ELM3711689.1 hypothetical protein [Aeromonas salmonicida subsp. salmonicida]ELT1967890.1 hypothetical protein [Aeromonas salmonicida]MDH7629119.1 hypothetical protein [Aeromonas salmonicida]QOI95454.1 hypothetical protein G7042_10465 [Aeromonas salmonicida subsp. masoucida]
MSGRKRKEAKVMSVPRSEAIEQLSINHMVMFNKNGVRFHMKRLKYRGVPELISGAGGGAGDFKKPDELVDANREKIIIELYRATPKSNNLISTTAVGYLRTGLTKYFKYIDEFDPQAIPFSIDSINNCLVYYNKMSLKGVKTTIVNSIKSAVSYFLRLMGRENDIRLLTVANIRRPSLVNVAYDIETELKPLSKILIRGHNSFLSHIMNNTIPELHPFFDEALIIKMANKENLTKNVGHIKHAFRMTVFPNRIFRNNKALSISYMRKIVMFNHASRGALFLFFMLTGMNTSVLQSMRRKDVVFKDIGSGKFIFNGIKHRAKNKEIDNALGFSSYTRRLIEEWLSATTVIYKTLNVDCMDDMPLLPYIRSDLSISDYNKASDIASGINFLIRRLLPFRINATRLRKTKSDILMRVTEDIYLVSQGLNNSVEVVRKSYSSGIKSDHDRNLSAAMEAQAAISKGEKINQAIDNAKILHSDILAEYDYKKRLSRNEISVYEITPSCVRCSGDDSLQSQLERRLKNLAVELKKDEHKCTNFLACFDCESHVLVASESDIWMMFSFHQQVLDIKELPSQNSIPKSKLYEIESI